MRKKDYLQLSEAKDRDAYNLLLNCRHSNETQLKEFLSTNRIKAYMKQRLIEQVDIAGMRVYRLTNKGYREFEKQLGAEHNRYHSNSILHDIKLADKYIEVMKNNANVEWRNEEDLKQLRNEQLKELRTMGDFRNYERLYNSSVCDCQYICNEVNICFDVITSNYTQQTIQEKVSFASVMGSEFNSIKI